jgi:hypothetical protein
MFKKFGNFITESGGMSNASPFKQNEVEPTVKWIESNIFPEIGLNGIEDDAFIIGSAGKKGPDETSGDIDIAVSADKIAGYLGVKLEKKEIIPALAEKIKKLGYEVKPSPGFSQVSIGVPISGKNDRTGQVDLMLSTDLEWSKFIYHSPDFSKAESRYKGAYRNMLLMSAIGKVKYEVVKTTDAGETEEYEAYVVRLDQGIYKVRKSFAGKKGLKKTADLLKEYDKLITKTPEKVVSILFKDTGPDEITSYEKLKKLIDSDRFKFPEKRKQIYDDFRERVQDSKLPLPDDITTESFVISEYAKFLKDLK